MKNYSTPTGKVCSRKDCNFAGIHKAGGTGTTWYCEKHYRFLCMRSGAQKNGKSVPTWEQCEEMLIECLDEHGELGLCPNCNHQMIWRTGADRKRGPVISLQHNLDGTMCFICTSCNVRHRNSKLGDDFFKLGSDEKLCPDCNTIKSLDRFSKAATMPDGLRGICRNCDNERGRKYRTERDVDPEKRAKRLAYMKEYGRKHRAKRNADPEKRAEYLAKRREYLRKYHAAKKIANAQQEVLV